MNKNIRFFALLLLLLLCRGAFAFDREAIHRASVSGLDLPSRNLASSPTTNLQTSSSSSFECLMSDMNHVARFTQDNSSIIALSGGAWLTAWNDDRFGANKIFWQRVTSTGTASGANTTVIGSAVGDDIVEPILRLDPTGKIYLFYRNQTRGELYFARFNSDLTADRASILTNDTSFGAYAGPFDAAVFPDGRVVIVWEDYGATTQTINYRIFDSTGTSQLGPSALPSEVSATSKWVPSIAIDPSTGFVVAWEDYRNGQSDIYARQFSGNGAAVGIDFSIVPLPASNQPQYAPKVAFCGADKYVIGWLDRRLGQEVYIQQFNPVSGLVGVNREISGPDTLTTNWNLDFSVAPSNALTASWGAFGSTNSIMSLRFATGLSAIGAATSRNMTTTGRRWSPVVAYSTSKRYGLAWTEFQNDDANIDLMLFDTAATRVLASEVRLNDDQSGSPSTNPSISIGNEWYELVAFQSRRADAGDIYCQAISVPGMKPDYNQKVSQDAGANLQSDPAITSGNNKSLVVWIDSRPLAGIAGQRIYGRFGNSIGYFTDNEICISDTAQAAIKGMPKVRIAKSGQALVVWLDKRSGNLQVWGRWLTSAGALDGSEFQISNSVGDLKNDELGLSIDTLGRFYAVWLDRNTAAPVVKGHWYNADKSSGGTFSWSPSIGVNISDIATDNLPAGNIGVLWTGLDVTVNRLYLAIITPSGSQVRQLLDITDNPAANPSEPTFAVAENGYVSAAWVDKRNGSKQVYYQVFDATLAAINGNAAASAVSTEFMTTPATATSRGRAWFTWVDPRESGLQVYITNNLYLPTAVDDGGQTLPSNFALEQNYPNPFNPTTTIQFSLPRAAAVTLTVYNLLGQEVVRLADGAPYAAGTFRVEWDGRDRNGIGTSSGVYFYKLTAGDFTQQRKMLLVK